MKHTNGSSTATGPRPAELPICLSTNGLTRTLTQSPARRLCITSGAGDLQRLSEVLQLDKFHLVGCAAGGFVAADYALSFPQRLHSLTLACTQGGVSDEGLQAIVKRLSLPAFLALPPEFKELGPSYRAANPQGMQRWVELQRSAAVEPRTTQGKLNVVTLARLRELAVPTLFVMGDADLYSPPTLMRQIAREVPGSQSVVIAECGHSPYWEQPEAFNAAVLSFLAAHRGAAGQRRA